MSPGGIEPEQFILQVGNNAKPTEGDALWAAQRQRTRIVERTLAGVDVDGAPFEPYSQNGPYYYYPNGRVGRTKFEKKKNRSAVKRLLGRLNADSDRASAVGVTLGTGGKATRGGEGIRFESYDDFKRSLGRTRPDLMGPRAPHMLQAIAVGANIERNVAEQSLSLTDRPQPAREIRIGIYGEEAGRALGHNTGENPRWRGRHQRRFLGLSDSDVQAMLDDILGRCVARTNQFK